MPTCDSAYAQKTATDTIANAPTGKIYGLSIVRFTDIMTVSDSPYRVECHAYVDLNNATQHGFAYSFYWDQSQFMVDARIDP